MSQKFPTTGLPDFMNNVKIDESTFIFSGQADSRF